jgi:hypothetical protein
MSQLKDRGMWVWNTRELVKDVAQIDRLIAKCGQAYVSDVYLYLVAEDYVTQLPLIQGLVTKLTNAGIKSWGLEGWRGYFSDAYGPVKYYAAIDGMIAYNAKVPMSAKLIGFHADLEPNDGQGAEFKTTFHNALKDSQLSTAPGSGVWKDTQANDRDYLMQNWLAIYTKTSQRLRASGLEFGAAMPSWVGDFYGETVHVTVNGTRQNLMPLMMALLDSYVVMSYSTNPLGVVAKMRAALECAGSSDTCKVYAALDCFPGGGSGSSYADTEGKKSRLAMMTDIAAIEHQLREYRALSGVCIHDWVGWDKLA